MREDAPPLTPAPGFIIDRSNRGRLDFTGAYGVYYRELFFHIPFLIANALNSRGRFAAAQRWYHYIFDPTASEAIDVPSWFSPQERARRLLDRVWRYLEFRGLDASKLREILTNEEALTVYRKDTFNPHAIARLRLSGYQKAVVMKYVDNLLDWADSLFAQFTMESVKEALMLYVMAFDILGKRPAKLGDCGDGGISPETYEDIAPLLDRGEELLVELESRAIGKRVGYKRVDVTNESDLALDAVALGRVRGRYEFAPIDPAAVNAGAEGSTDGDRSRDSAVFRGFDWKTTRMESWGPNLGAATTIDQQSTLSATFEHLSRSNVADKFGMFPWSIVRQAGPVFCIPENKELLAYWDRVEDRLYKIRHCMDISGQKRELALFAPEIDPHLLVQMRAAGLTLEDVLGTTNGNLPPYRFLYLIDRAKAFAASLSSFGAALLSALEKKDAEEMNRLRLVHQQNLAKLTTRLRNWDIEVAQESLAALQRQKEAAEYRREYYNNLISTGRNPGEAAQSEFRHIASLAYETEALTQTLAGIAALFPQLGFPFAITFGGIQLQGSSRAFGAVVKAAAQGSEAVAASTGLEAGFERRNEGWEHQKELAVRDVNMLERQIKAADIRVRIAERSLAVHEKSIEQLDEILERTDGKFTNLGLYTWLSTRLRHLHRDAYQNAVALARLAEQAFRFERGDDASPGLSSGNDTWDVAHGGLLAGEQLLIDLQNLERRFLETNYRSLEVDQAFALSQISPQALINLREEGECTFRIPELFFDLYYPGHYKRRIKAVRLTIPSITGPYVNVSATLTLERSWIRPTPAADPALLEVPPRRTVSVATSTAQNDAGVFELSFRDERYMPFEGAGAVSEWRLTLPKAFRQFDYETITEVILSISYTAEQDGALRERVESDNERAVNGILTYLRNNSVSRLFSLRQDFSSAFTRLLHSAIGTEIAIVIEDRHFPAFLRGKTLQVQQAQILLRTEDAVTLSGFQLTADAAPVSGFMTAGRPGQLLGQNLPVSFGAHLRGTHTFAIQSAGDLAPTAPIRDDTSVIDPDKLLDVLLYVEFRLGN